ncbi:MAG: toll/interleukin-1 receptor domain-containing protein [Actinomycetota bacterium]|nr:toll/interleukin-1 receptor domain-containing protein [Actinomycetota bacterium]
MGDKRETARAMAFQIFISYRRDDSSGYSGRLYDALSQRFGDESVFMDIDTIEPGEDFTDVVERRVGSCDVLIALIGGHWLGVTDGAGRPRLQNPQDWVRIELETGLRSIRTHVIPALVQDVEMPGPDQLPESLGPLSDRNAIELSDARWHYDVERLIRRLEELAGLAPASAPRPARRSRARPRWLLPAIVAGVVAVAAAVAAVLAFTGGDGSSPADYVRTVDAQLTRSAAEKVDLPGLVFQVENKFRAQTSAMGEIDRIIRQRTRLLDDLPTDPPAPFREAHRLLRASIVAALAEDRAVRDWARAVYAQAPSTDTLEAEMLRLGRDASELRQDFITEYNRVRRAELGLTETFVNY